MRRRVFLSRLYGGSLGEVFVLLRQRLLSRLCGGSRRSDRTGRIGMLLSRLCGGSPFLFSFSLPASEGYQRPVRSPSCYHVPRRHRPLPIISAHRRTFVHVPKNHLCTFAVSSPSLVSGHSIFAALIHVCHLKPDYPSVGHISCGVGNS
jgi:hypothetical protein